MAYAQAAKKPPKTPKILNSIDEIYTDNPEYGYRYIHQQLLEDGLSIGQDRVLKYISQPWNCTTKRALF